MRDNHHYELAEEPEPIIKNFLKCTGYDADRKDRSFYIDYADEEHGAKYLKSYTSSKEAILGLTSLFQILPTDETGLETTTVNTSLVVMWLTLRTIAGWIETVICSNLIREVSPRLTKRDIIHQPGEL
jgi:hypothetical protein